MSYYCDCCYKTIKLISKKHFKSFTHKEFDKCKHITLTIENSDLKKIDNTVNEYIIEYDKETDY